MNKMIAVLTVILSCMAVFGADVAALRRLVSKQGEAIEEQKKIIKFLRASLVDADKRLTKMSEEISQREKLISYQYVHITSLEVMMGIPDMGSSKDEIFRYKMENTPFWEINISIEEHKAKEQKEMISTLTRGLNREKEYLKKLKQQKDTKILIYTHSVTIKQIESDITMAKVKLKTSEDLIAHYKKLISGDIYAKDGKSIKVFSCDHSESFKLMDKYDAEIKELQKKIKEEE